MTADIDSLCGTFISHGHLYEQGFGDGVAVAHPEVN